MKKTIFFTFVLAAGFVATFLSGCGDDKGNNTCLLLDGTSMSDTGAHDIYLDKTKIGDLITDLKPIRDSLAVKVYGDSISIYSKVLNFYMSGKKDPFDCNKIILDSVIINGAALAFETELPGIDSVRITNIRAGGTGSVTSTSASTQINIVTANTNILIGSPGGFGDLRNLAGKKVNLKGSFLKIP